MLCLCMAIQRRVFEHVVLLLGMTGHIHSIFCPHLATLAALLAPMHNMRPMHPMRLSSCSNLLVLPDHQYLCLLLRLTAGLISFSYMFLPGLNAN